MPASSSAGHSVYWFQQSAPILTWPRGLRAMHGSRVSRARRYPVGYSPAASTRGTGPAAPPGPCRLALDTRQHVRDPTRASHRVAGAVRSPLRGSSPPCRACRRSRPAAARSAPTPGACTAGTRPSSPRWQRRSSTARPTSRPLRDRVRERRHGRDHGGLQPGHGHVHTTAAAARLAIDARARRRWPCARRTRMGQQFVAALSLVTSYSVNGDQLTLRQPRRQPPRPDRPVARAAPGTSPGRVSPG